jgi:hypothetical protein
MNRNHRRALIVLVIAALLGVAGGSWLFDYSEDHGVSAQPWLERHFRESK